MSCAEHYTPRRRRHAITPSASVNALRVVTPAPRAVWTALCEASTEATIFHRPEWLDACCRAGGFEDVSRLYETIDGHQIIFPLVRSGAFRPAWRTSWSLPRGWGLGGAFGSRPIVAEDVTMMLGDVLRDSGRLVVSPGPLTGAAWAAAPAQTRVRHEAHVLDLREGSESLWSRSFSKSTRNKIRKAERRGVEVEWGRGSELMHVHWELFIRWKSQLAQQRGIPVRAQIALAKHQESLARYEAIARSLGERCQVIVARVDGRPAASSVTLLDGIHAHDWRAASDNALIGRRYANYLLVARILEGAAARGCHYVHMGESGGKRTLIEFKEHFGARPVSYDEVRFGPVAMTKSVRGGERLRRSAEELAFYGAARLQSLSARSKNRRSHGGSDAAAR